MRGVSLDSLCRWKIQVSVYCAWRIPAHLRCTQCSIMLYLMDICFLTCICLWQMSQIQTRLFKVVGPGLVSTSPAFVSKLLLQPSHHLRRRVKNPPNPLRQSNRVHLFMNWIQTNTGKSKESSPVTSVHISPIKFNNSILNKEPLKRSYSDFLSETSPSRSQRENYKVKKVDNSIMYSDVHKNDREPMIFLMALFSAPTKQMSHSHRHYIWRLTLRAKGKLRRISSCDLLINILDFVYNIFFYILYIHYHTL